MLPLARTPSEAHVFMDLHPCVCGETSFERSSAVVEAEGDLASVYRGGCPSCGTTREFRFRLPERPLFPVGAVSYGDERPSELLDPGEWLALADEHAQRTPATRGDVAIAVAALEEVLKFGPPDAERISDEAFTTPRGRAVRDAEPGRFRRSRLEAVLGAYRGLLDGRRS